MPLQLLNSTTNKITAILTKKTNTTTNKTTAILTKKSTKRKQRNKKKKKNPETGPVAHLGSPATQAAQAQARDPGHAA